jgi:enoyl-CoA hydratase/carnithine racemase
LQRTTLEIGRRGSALLLTLHNPSGYPRLELALLRELRMAVDRASADDTLRGIVLTGGRNTFCAGAALEEVGVLDGVSALAFSAEGQQTMGRIARSPKRVVAAIGEYCLGGGLDLALACHARIAAPDAEFGHPGGSLGIITGWGGTVRLRRRIGTAVAREMLVTGRRVRAQEAYRWGLVDAIVAQEELLSAAVERATARQERISGNA